ncbi:MAG: hypothetical protein AAF517_17035, partial [Planctomycetota bacterium]
TLDWDGDASISVTDAVGILLWSFTDGPAHALGVDCVRLDGCPDACARDSFSTTVTEAGSYLRVQNADGATLLTDHFPSSFLVGRSPGAFLSERRNYFAFDLSELDGDVVSARIRIFSNFETTKCAHRDDFGCGYASDDESEVFELRSLDVASDRLVRSDPKEFEEIFEDLGDGAALGSVEMTRDDVDVWLDVELRSEALDEIRESAARGGTWAVGGWIRTLSENLSRREWLFVDHLLPIVIAPELVIERR